MTIKEFESYDNKVWRDALKNRIDLEEIAQECAKDLGRWKHLVDRKIPRWERLLQEVFSMLIVRKDYYNNDWTILLTWFEDCLGGSLYHYTVHVVDGWEESDDEQVRLIIQKFEPIVKRIEIECKRKEGATY